MPELATLVPVPDDGALAPLPGRSAGSAGPAERLMEMQWSDRRAPQPALQQQQPARPAVPLPFFVPSERPAAEPRPLPPVERPMPIPVGDLPPLPATVAQRGLPPLPEQPTRAVPVVDGVELPRS